MKTINLIATPDEKYFKNYLYLPFTWVFLMLIISMTNNSIVNAQVVNAYAKVTAITSNVLTVSNLNETFHTFNIGEKVIVMQMQDNVIGGTNDDTNFGTLSSIGSAGLYEVGKITAKTATTITLENTPTNLYTTGANSSVQVISFRLYGSPSYTTTADMAALDWDGNVGGVLAIEVNATLTLNHNMNADGAGFRGGGLSTNEGTVDCNAVYRTNNSGLSGEKGEGIFKRTDINHQYGRAKIINGGGGGNRHNAGGGGGGNVVTGGNGGPGYNCSGNPVGGQGGISLNSLITINRIFMGGGGGGGQQNNGIGTAGMDGGGIILIKAAQIITSGACSNRIVSANGLTSSNPNNDGAGGAGAGGTIVFDVNSFAVLSACPVSISANGGNGGSSTAPDTHGGGGGGSQGKVFYTQSTPVNVVTTTNNGTSGCNNNSNPCTDQAPPPAGTNGTGIASNSGGSPLPIQLVSFDISYFKGRVIASWITANEINNDFFTLERSADGIHFETISIIDGAGTTTQPEKYSADDVNPVLGKSYYRLKQTDWDKREESFGVRAITIDELREQQFDIVVSPNPTSTGKFDVTLLQSSNDLQVDVINLAGQSILKRYFNAGAKIFEVDLPEEITPGLYFVKVLTMDKNYVSKLVVK